MELISGQKRYYLRQYIEIICMIFVSVSPLISDLLKGALAVVMFSLLFIRKYHYCSGFETKGKSKIYILILIGCLFLYAIIDLFYLTRYPYSLYNIYVPFQILAGYSVFRRYDKEEFLNLVERIIYIILYLSLVGFFVLTFFPGLIMKLPVYRYHETEHYTAFAFNVLRVGNYIVTRNTGIAREPGVFQILLNIGLAINIKKTKPRIFKIALYFIAILTTKSTIGIAIAAIIITYYIIANGRKIYGLIFLAFAIGSIFVFGDMFAGQYYKIFGDSGSFGSTDSFTYRWLPTLNSMKASFVRLVGFGNSQYSFREDLGAFDSYTDILGRYGMVVFLLIVRQLIRGMKEQFLLYLAIIITLTSQTIWTTPLIAFFYFAPFSTNLFGGQKYEKR